MAVTNLSRTMRDGAIVIKDGTATPLQCAVYCDDGDLSWTNRYEKVVTRCRGTITTRRTGDAQECQLSFSVHWTNLVNYAVEVGSAAIQPYEIINQEDADFTSTSTGLYTLDYEFTCTDPEAAATELIVFPDVFCNECTCTEGDPNTIQFSGESSAAKPTITQP